MYISTQLSPVHWSRPVAVSVSCLSWLPGNRSRGLVNHHSINVFSGLSLQILRSLVSLTSLVHRCLLCCCESLSHPCLLPPPLPSLPPPLQPLYTLTTVRHGNSCGLMAPVLPHGNRRVGDPGTLTVIEMQTQAGSLLPPKHSPQIYSSLRPMRPAPITPMAMITICC